MHFSIINWGPNNITLTNFMTNFNFLFHHFKSKNPANTLFENKQFISGARSIRIYLQNYFFFRFQIKKLLYTGLKKETHYPIQFLRNINTIFH